MRQPERLRAVVAVCAHCGLELAESLIRNGDAVMPTMVSEARPPDTHVSDRAPEVSWHGERGLLEALAQTASAG